MPLLAVNSVADGEGPIVVGFDRLYLRLKTNNDLIAFDAQTGKAMPLGSLPIAPSYGDMAFVDGWRAVYPAPVFAGLVAVVNSYRKSKGLPRVGFLNPSLYTSPAVRASFRDVILGGTDQFNAKPGWDYPTGWGAPRAKLLADALP